MGKSKIKLINRLYFNSPPLLKNIFATIYGCRDSKKRYGQLYYQFLDELNKIEYLNDNQLKELQFQKIKHTLIHAYKHSEFYNKLFNVIKFEPDNFRIIEEIKSLPVLEKETVRKYEDEILCNGISDKVNKVKTSGTTGKPLTIHITDYIFQINHAIQHQLYKWNGLNESFRMAKCAGQEVARVDKNKPPFWVEDYYSKNLYLSSYHLSDSNLESYIRKLNKFKPDVIEGYPSSIYLLAKANKKYSGSITPKFIRTGSETLFDYQRAVIEESFQCKARNFYGSAENCVKAIECPEGKIHLIDIYGYSEVLNEDGSDVQPGETGRLVATGFLNDAFPLIRYNTGDLAKLSMSQKCTCGRSGKLLDAIVGRTDDYIITPDGKRIGRMDHIFKGVSGVINGQIIQNEIGRIIIKIVKDENFNSKSELMVRENIMKRAGKSVEVEFDYVEEIPKESNGKFKFVKSFVK